MHRTTYFQSLYSWPKTKYNSSKTYFILTDLWSALIFLGVCPLSERFNTHVHRIKLLFFLAHKTDCTHILPISHKNTIDWIVLGGIVHLWVLVYLSKAKLDCCESWHKNILVIWHIYVDDYLISNLIDSQALHFSCNTTIHEASRIYGMPWGPWSACNFGVWKCGKF